MFETVPVKVVGMFSVSVISKAVTGFLFLFHRGRTRWNADGVVPDHASSQAELCWTFQTQYHSARIQNMSMDMQE